MRPRLTTRRERIALQLKSNALVLAILFGVPMLNDALLRRGGIVATLCKEAWVWVWNAWIIFSVWAFIGSVVLVVGLAACGAVKMVDERGRE